MRPFFIAFLFPAAISALFFTTGRIDPSDERRFAVTIDGRKGFIDASGTVVIAPQFEDVMEFSEGLCAVRLKGRYGFIDTRGELRIPAVYDYATTFKAGLALVYIDGKPMFITSGGKPAFQSGYASISLFQHGVAQVKTSSGKYGLIDRTGILVVDTMYSRIQRIKDGYSIIYELNDAANQSSGKPEDPCIAVADSTGRMVFPFGKFGSVESYHDGNFFVYYPGTRGSEVGAIVDSRGKELFSLRKNDGSWIEGNIHDGIVRVSSPERRNSDDFNDIYVNTRGEVIYSSRNTKYGTDFRDNVAFVGDENFQYSLIDRTGNIISSNKFKLPSYDVNPFENGLAVVKLEDGMWGVINTSGQTILKTGYTEIYPEKLIQEQYLFFREEENGVEETRYGLMDLEGKVLVQPVMETFDFRGFIDDMLKAVVDGRVAYFNRAGQKIWHDEADKSRTPSPLNIDYMNRGYFYADGDNTGHPTPPDYAVPRSVTPGQFPDNEILVHADPAVDDIRFSQTTKGRLVHVANTTPHGVTFNAQDNRLYMKMQAYDPGRNWRDIEYLPNSWCGNSYHTIELKPQNCWTFIAPVYSGAMKTRLRVALTFIDPSLSDSDDSDENQVTIYSNEFEGSINPAQFWRRPEYSPSGIMDPYLE